MSATSFFHRSVLLTEILTSFETISNGLIIDCTLGLGGHSETLLSTKKDINLLGIDRDLIAIKCAEERLFSFGKRFQSSHTDFRDIKRAVTTSDFSYLPVQGILVDLGVSSMQLDTPSRGFSFQHEGPLDMRMDFSQGETAADLVNSLLEEELADLIYEYGEEPAARVIARHIVNNRELKAIKTTRELALIVAKAVAWRERKLGHKIDYNQIHPATRTFQALRIAVNQELTNLDKFVMEAIDLLVPNGRLAIISFHSLEDRIIKNTYRAATGVCQCPPRLPQCICGRKQKVTLITKKPLISSETEKSTNPRSRSAKLRVCEKL